MAADSEGVHARTAAGVLETFRLDGRTAIVTGAGRGLGRAMAAALVGAGACVAIFDVNREDIDSAAAELRGLGATVVARAVDVGDEAQVAEAVEAVARELGGLHILVNNAGVTTRAPFEELTEEDWQHVIDINLGGLFRCCKHAARQFAAQGGGAIINIASISGLVGNRGGLNSHYSASKGGVIALTRALAVEWAPKGIRVNAIAPGYFVTSMTERLKERDLVFYKELVERVPLGRFGRAQDLAGAVVFLSSEASAYLTGAVLVVDGGYTAW